jgi:hypothetical protein
MQEEGKTLLVPLHPKSSSKASVAGWEAAVDAWENEGIM